MFASDGLEKSLNDPLGLISSRRAVAMSGERLRIVTDERMPKLSELRLLIGVENVSFMSDTGIEYNLVVLLNRSKCVLLAEVEGASNSQEEGLESLGGVSFGADVIRGEPNQNRESSPEETRQNGVNPRKAPGGYYVSFGAQIFVVFGVLLLILFLLTFGFYDWLPKWSERRSWEIFLIENDQVDSAALPLESHALFGASDSVSCTPVE